MTTILKPGILVSLKTTVRGGITYERVGLAAEAGTDGASVARWETTRIIDDPDEYSRANQVRTAASSVIRKVCTKTTFGLLCSEAMEAELTAAMAKARALCDEFNATATTTSVRVFTIKGRIASTDEEAARAIASEVTLLLEDMQRGIKEADPKKIREAANKARELGSLLGPEQSEKVAKAVETARSAARAIVRRVEKAGEDAKLVIQELTVAPIEVARFAFLDMEDGADADAAPESGEAMPEVNLQRFAGLDMDESAKAEAV